MPERAVAAAWRACSGRCSGRPSCSRCWAAVVALDVWVFFSHGIGGGLRSALYNAAAAAGDVRRGDRRDRLPRARARVSAAATAAHGPACSAPAIYIVWPAFYCDVTDAYRLDRAGRLRTDLGGVYFNALFALAAGGLFLATGWELLVLVILTQHTIILQQLLPLLRFDGYYVVTDLTGVPDILSRIKPIFASLVPGRRADPRECRSSSRGCASS